MSVAPIFLRDLGMRYPTEKSKKKFRYGVYICPKCKDEYETIKYSVKMGKSTKCEKCRRKVLEKGNYRTHGMTNSRLYQTWDGVIQRCNNDNNPSCKNYKGRGIVLCQEWRDSFEVFHDWALANGYEDHLTIDRRDNDGNYEPDNCRWVTKETQVRNTRRLRKNNTSGYRGVGRAPNGKYRARINIHKEITLGTFDYPWTAGMVYDSYVIKHNLEHTMNFIKRKIA